MGMPVETERGLVGRVVAVSPHAAQVQLLTDPGSAINARLAATDDFFGEAERPDAALHREKSR